MEALKAFGFIVFAAIVCSLLGMGVYAIGTHFDSRQTVSVAMPPIYNDPVLVASKDGCDTFSFLGVDNHTHYYTRCPNATVTHDQSWDEVVRHGKTYQTEHHQESITTDSQ
jgi:hypothetical protein